MLFGTDYDFVTAESQYAVCSPYTMPASPPPDYALEREFCTNFICCGQSLADLHSLIDHFEASHAFVLDADGRPIYPVPFSHRDNNLYLDNLSEPEPPSPTGSTLSSSSSEGSDSSSLCSSFMFDYPQMTSPDHYGASIDLDPITYGADPFDARLDQGTLTLSTVEFGFDSMRSQWGPYATPYGEVDESHYSASGISDPDGGLQAREDVEVLADGSEILQAHSEEVTGEILPPLTTTSKNKVPFIAPSRWKKRPREKIKCPRAGCTKSYLNPNGLKYHTERGTCEFAPRGGKR